MTKLPINGECAVSNAVAIKRRIIETLGRRDGIEIDLANVSDIDLAGFQLLIATVKECDARSVECALSGALPQQATNRAEDAGFINGSIGVDTDFLTLLRAYT
jgi:anti-anti-sigma regulatory factor